MTVLVCEYEIYLVGTSVHILRDILRGGGRRGGGHRNRVRRVRALSR